MKEEKLICPFSDDYEIVIPTIPISTTGCEVSVTSLGILKIKNKIKRDSVKRSFFNIKVFHSKINNNYITTATYRKSFTIQDINLVIKNGNMKPLIAIQCLNLDTSLFLINEATRVVAAKNQNDLYFFDTRENKMSWLTRDYFIIH